MKRIIATLFAAVFCHLFSRDSEATATYDTSLAATIQFSQPWVSVAPVTTPDPNPFVGPAVTKQHSEGNGAFTAFTGASQSGNLSAMTYSQTVRVYGSAGNATLDQSGYSLGQSFLVNLFTFDFGSTPTNFTLSVLTYAPMFNYSMDRPATPNSMGTGESVGGGTGFQFILDGSFSINPTDTDSFIGLTGVHTVRFTTQAVDQATGVYPFQVPDHGSTLLLLTLSLLGLVTYRQQVSSARPNSLQMNESRYSETTRGGTRLADKLSAVLRRKLRC
jgi:hypothetical protein